jgi:predicted Fe-Mo cluster-binding NifX family protein
MRVAVTAEATGLESRVDPRFGRCPFFVIVDPATMRAHGIPNPHTAREDGAGIHATKLMADYLVDVVCTGHLGPSAAATLRAAGIVSFTGCTGTVREVIERYKTTGQASASVVAPLAGSVWHWPVPTTELGRHVGPAGGLGQHGRRHGLRGPAGH